MSENLDWQNKQGINFENEANQMTIQGGYDEEKQFDGSENESYAKENRQKEVSPLKTIFGTLVIIAIAWVLIAGFVNDTRYLQILGLSVLGLVVLSLIISLFRPGRVNFWALWYLGDLIEILVYIIALIIRIAIEIASSK
ncbi:hypothetical protein DSAG12_02689 [Promethearchaeum syntrophicum]|uniref:Uncharacterized protein n=1 Tax=Promethearchaeum syntrophicum TaxID=2594042 RepID=A0A5B9DC42_9ARCH|nr:hypothetical protein [Candidatus Prometheoarchaeum syntrophicum]QEE16859.1 hypothetical protein DSAG12_02689 [Candidatus Prometheoarchaeum syntrophicum]